MKRIGEFKSYRDFLRACHAESKSACSGLSIDQYASRLGLSGSLLKMIFTGKRGLTIAQIHQVARALRMSFEETEIFEALVLSEQSKSAVERAFYKKRLRQAKSKHETQHLRISRKELLSEPLLPALLVYLMEFRTKGERAKETGLDINELATIFGTSPETMQTLIGKLRTAGLLTLDGGSKCHLVFDKVVNLVSQKQYIGKVLAESMQRLETGFEDPNSFFSTYTFTTSVDSLQSLQLDLKSLMDKYMTQKHTQSVKIAQASFQIYPTVSLPDPNAISAASRTKRLPRHLT